MLEGERSTPGGAVSELFVAMPTVILSDGTRGRQSDQSIVLSGGVANANANGVWTATVLLSDGGAPVEVGVVTITVTPTPDAPTYVTEVLSVTVAETDVPVTVDSLTMPTDVNDVDGDTLTVMLEGVRSTPGGEVSELFETMPTVSLSGAPGAQNRQNIVLSGGVANANANGVWAATVLLSDGRTTEKVGVVTISVAPTRDAPTFVTEVLSVTVDETDAPVTIDSLTVATDVNDVDGDTLTVMLEGVRSTPDGAVSELFETMPMVSLSGAPGAQNRQSIVLSGGVANANANGVWTATVILSDDVTTPVKVGVVTITVAPTPDVPTFVKEVLSVTVDETDAPVTIDSLTVATDVNDMDGDTLTVMLEGVRSTPGGAVSELFETMPTVSLASDASVWDNQNIVLSGGVANANANGVWTATVILSDDVTTPVEAGVVTISVAPTRDAPTFVTEVLSVTVAETDVPVTIDSLTVATDVNDVDGDTLTVVLEGLRSTPGGMISELFETMPTVSLSGAPGAQNHQNIVLSGGVANADANGVWTATVLLSDGVTTPVEVGVVTITVAPTPDAPTYVTEVLSITVDETDAPVTIDLLTMATDVSDVDGGTLRVVLEGERSTPGGAVSELFETMPTVAVSDNTGVQDNQNIVLSGGVANADANGVWTATVWLWGDGIPARVGVVTISVAPTPDAPTYVTEVLSVTVDETDAPVTIDSLTVATDVNDVDGDTLTVMLEGVRSTPDGAVSELFETMPMVSLSGAPGAQNRQSIVLSGGVANANANGVWTATVILSDDVTTPVEVGVVTITVAPTPDAPTFVLGQTLSVRTDETNTPVTIEPLTVAMGVNDVDGDTLRVFLEGERSTPGGAVSGFFETMPTECR